MKRTMDCEIVTIGSELLLGQIVDTNASYLAEVLNSVGISIVRHTTVGDTMEDIVEALTAAMKRADVVITSGGIGPTEDDLTREASARMLGVTLEYRQDLMDYIEDLITRAGFVVAPTNRRQAFIPRGSEPIINPVGTAPGFIAEKDGAILLTLPGVPRELKYLMKHAIIPFLKEQFDLGDGVIHYRVLNVTGKGESGIDEMIGDLIRKSVNPQIGLLASPGLIRIRITAQAPSLKEAEELISPVEKELRARLGTLIFGEGDVKLEGVVDNMLTDLGLSLSLLETFTGGLAAWLLNRAQSGSLKESRFLTHRDDLEKWLEKHHISPVDDEDRAALAARRLMQETNSDVGLSILGFLERKDKGSEVAMAVGAVGPWGEKTAVYRLGGDAEFIMQRGAVIGLNVLRKALLDSIE